MGLPDITEEAVLAAIEEFDRLGRAQFLSRYGFSRARGYFCLYNGREYDSKALVGAAHGYATGIALRPRDFSGGEATVIKALRQLGFTTSSPDNAGRSDKAPSLQGIESLSEEVTSSRRTLAPDSRDHRAPTVVPTDAERGGAAAISLQAPTLRTRPHEESTAAEERSRRLAIWAELRRNPEWPDLPPRTVRALGAYGGAQGVWVDKERTKLISPDGVAVGILHTGRHYADDLAPEAIVYHYPNTRRPPSRDAGEVAAVKNCRNLRIPLFVVTETRRGTRRVVDLAWVADYDDDSRLFLIEFGEEPSDGVDVSIADSPFQVQVARKRTRSAIERAERDPGFKFQVHKRFHGRCAVTGISVSEMLEAAHVVPVARGGSDDPRNGLLLTADLHRAFDAWLWAINPEDRSIMTRPQGPTLQAMGKLPERLPVGTPLPNPEALSWRAYEFSKRYQ